MIRAFMKKTSFQYLALWVGLGVITVVGGVNTPEFAKHIIPQFYWNNQIFWTERQLVYAQRDMDYTNWSVENLRATLENPLNAQELQLQKPALEIAERKMIARRQRSIEKENLLKFKVERLKRKAAENMGVDREPQHVEGL